MGFAISENGDNMFYIFTNQRYPFLYEEIVNWGKINWSGRGNSLYTEVVENQESEMKILENNNFISKGVCEVTRAFNCKESLNTDIKLPNGFYFSNMKENFDPINQCKMKLNTFGNKDVVSEIERVFTHNDYRQNGFAKKY